MEQNQLAEQLKKELTNPSLDRKSQVQVITEAILQDLGALDEQHSKSSKEIISQYEKIAADEPVLPDIPVGTFLVNLTKVAAEQNSRINCPGRKQGYYLEQLVKELEEIEQQELQEEVKQQEQEASRNRIREEDLYPVLERWLLVKNYDRVGITSAMNANGKWGNPDLVAFKFEDIYGKSEIEMTTVEVKLTNENWGQWIFEAVAHTRFADRSYFAFMHPEETMNKLDSSQLKLYAEHFKIGILVIPIPIENYTRIRAREDTFLDLDSLEVHEYFPAPQTITHIRLRKLFLKAANLLEMKQLYSFGKEVNSAPARQGRPC